MIGGKRTIQYASFLTKNRATASNICAKILAVIFVHAAFLDEIASIVISGHRQNITINS